MRVIKGDVIGWEPMVLTIVYLSGRQSSCAAVEANVRAWFSLPGEKPCRCALHELTAHSVGRDACVLNIEGICEQCLPSLIDYIAKHQPGIKQITIGILARDDESEEPEEPYVVIPSGPVLFEDGTVVSVLSFQVLRRAVTVGMFDTFAKTTGYITVAERKGGENFRKNGTLAGASRRIQQDLPAVCIAYDDATAYAGWSQARLPSEAEWLAMANANNEVYSSKDELGSAWPTIRKHFQVEITTTELTSTCEQALVVTRTGPKRARVAGWERAVIRNRRLVKPTACSIMMGFRTVRMP
jgi:hypothetical protein